MTFREKLNKKAINQCICVDHIFSEGPPTYRFVFYGTDRDRCTVEFFEEAALWAREETVNEILAIIRTDVTASYIKNGPSSFQMREIANWLEERLK